MKLRFPESEIEKWACRYSYPVSDENLRVNTAPAVKKQCYCTLTQLRELVEWKSPRAKSKPDSNSESFVEAVTRTAFSTHDDRLQIEVLTLLDGVGWPIASAILHFFVSDRYPILDYRALWSLQVDIKPYQYNFKLWQEYVEWCQETADRLGVPVRKLDKALWQYSNENQPPQK